jgi:ABC-2 type transport system ATP-binding protein
MIRTENLQRTFGRVQALDGLSLHVEKNRVYGFLGPNGAGKTTTIRVLTGLMRPTAGRAWVNGIPLEENHHRIARLIGYLPEEPAYYPWMTPREFLDHVGRVFGLDGAERNHRVEELLELVDLREAGGRRIGGFSRGMRQRLGLAQALVNRPVALLLDEPVSALDPAGRRDVLELIARLRGSCTVFMSTHVLADVERVCDTVGIIHRGRLVAEAPRDELIARFALPAFDLECVPGQEERMAAWIARIADADWVASATHNGALGHVVAAEIDRARQALLPSAIEAGLVLIRYETVRPSLEEVFLRLVQEQEPAAEQPREEVLA